MLHICPSTTTPEKTGSPKPAAGAAPVGLFRQLKQPPFHVSTASISERNCDTSPFHGSKASISPCIRLTCPWNMADDPRKRYRPSVDDQPDKSNNGTGAHGTSESLKRGRKPSISFCFGGGHVRIDYTYRGGGISPSIHLGNAVTKKESISGVAGRSSPLPMFGARWAAVISTKSNRRLTCNVSGSYYVRWKG
jgi:hypothetical protein